MISCVPRQWRPSSAALQVITHHGSEKHQTKLSFEEPQTQMNVGDERDRERQTDRHREREREREMGREMEREMERER